MMLESYPVYAVYVEKKEGLAIEAAHTFADLSTALRLDGRLKSLRLINRYFVQGLSGEDFKKSIPNVFSEPAVDEVYHAPPRIYNGDRIFAVEYLPGQFDQRADSCEQCIQMLTAKERCTVKNARLYLLTGDITDDEFQKIKAYLINPVESREASLQMPDTLESDFPTPPPVKCVEGFLQLGEPDAPTIADFIKEYGLAMDEADVLFSQKYFRDTEHREPTVTELRMIDTYWSDHCRHTTFSTEITNATIQPDYIADAYKKYLLVKMELDRQDKPLTLMELATLAARKLKKDGLLSSLDESEEINACTVKVQVDNAGKKEDWLLLFKNETHNHPTEIEPFGGAATCLGGAIRDPLSGRAYVYQAMRVTGAANPLVPVQDTMHGKLPQRKITVGAAHGYSSYGNQIGLATGHVNEIYHPGYVAKRMEVGAVIAAAPAGNVVRKQPLPGDVIVLLGGKTGRDGCGGATGSSKSHDQKSLSSCGAEVQKGNAPEERKIQRLFRNEKVTSLIKRCNDFGAGGISVAIGELADGLAIDLNRVPKKYDGLDGTELAISESQERMAVVIAEKDFQQFLQLAAEENLEATGVAVVTAEPRLRMRWNGDLIVDLSRDFLNSNGAPKQTAVYVPVPIMRRRSTFSDCKDSWMTLMSDLNVCSQKGLIELFDSTNGAATILMPFGGRFQDSPSQAMAALLPVPSETKTASVMAHGFNPYLSSKSPYHGAIAAVIESLAKVVAAGGSYKGAWLTFQEYFPRTKDNPSRWGLPFAALLGAFIAQLELGCAAIGGKDSMSGSFENIDVPPTLVSFAVSVTDADNIISTDFKHPGSQVVRLSPKYNENDLPDFQSVRDVFDTVQALTNDKKVLSAWSVGFGGVAEAVVKMSFGNRFGFKFAAKLPEKELFYPVYGSIILELPPDFTLTPNMELIGWVTPDYFLDNCGLRIPMHDLQHHFERRLEPVFPTSTNNQQAEEPVRTFSSNGSFLLKPKQSFVKPKVLLPVFPGTNCEYDSFRAFEQAGASPEFFIVKNLSASDIQQSIDAIIQKIQQSQIIMFSGGFSGGDEPDGSGKFITAFFRNPAVKDAVHDFIKKQDGLMLGICNGFQVLLKLGLITEGEIVDMKQTSPTLTYNSIGRHQSKMVLTRIASNRSPWLASCRVGDVHAIPISHTEGRFVASPDWVNRLAENGQIATQYVDYNEQPTMDVRCNPNGSVEAIEGVFSPDGRIFGKMGHSERAGRLVSKNVPGDKNQNIFKSGVDYFK